MTLCLICNGVMAQNDEFSPTVEPLSPKSPVAAEFAKYVDYPVSKYTGVPDISIPLYTINTGSLSVPITLSYHASGIKASQEATCVGLGWNLNAGGVITRSVVCVDDLGWPKSTNASFLRHTPRRNPEDLQPWDITGAERVLHIDSEPDIFCCNLPTLSCKFILTLNDEGKITPVIVDKEKANIKIKLSAVDRELAFFIITDSEGNEYYLSRREFTQAYTINNSSLVHLKKEGDDINEENEPRFNEDYFSPEYISSWYLEKIVTPKNDSILYEYEHENYKLPTMESMMHSTLVAYDMSSQFAVGPPRPKISDYYSQSTPIVYSYRLSKVKWKHGCIELYYSNRDDVRTYNWYGKDIPFMDRDRDFSSGKPGKLVSMKIYDNLSNQVIKDYVFNYSYFNGNNNSKYPYLYKRLKLDSVQDNLIENYKFSFGYINGELPVKNTHSIDYWGYYNGKKYTQDKFYPSVYLPLYDAYFEGVDRSSDFEYMKIGTLKSVGYPTGGDISFEYEANTYTKAFYEKDKDKDDSNTNRYSYLPKIDKGYKFAYNKIVNGGGLRIKRMIGAKVTSYIYQGGLCIIKPRVWRLANVQMLSGNIPVSSFRYMEQSSHCAHSLTTLKGGHSFGYSEVTEKFDDGSFARYTYHNEEEVEDKHPSMHTNVNYSNGLVKSVEVINNKGYQSLLTEYNYSYKHSKDTVFAFYFDGIPSFYQYNIQWPLLSSKHTVTYQNSDPYAPENVEHRDLFYNDNCFLTKEVISNYRNNDSYVRQYYYSNDFDTPVMRNMQERYMIGKPVKTLTMRKGLVVEGKKTDYAEQNGIIVPISENRIETSIPLSQENCETSFKEKIHYSDFTPSGHPMQVSSDAMNVVYLWGYKDTYPIAEIKNATFAQVSALLGESFIKTLQISNIPTELQINRIMLLSQSLPNSLITVYEYDGQKGLKTINGPNSNIENYEYDAAGRLIRMKENGATREEYQYNYRK